MGFSFPIPSKKSDLKLIIDKLENILNILISTIDSSSDNSLCTDRLCNLQIVKQFTAQKDCIS